MSDEKVSIAIASTGAVVAGYGAYRLLEHPRSYYSLLQYQPELLQPRTEIISGSRLTSTALNSTEISVNLTLRDKYELRNSSIADVALGAGIIFLVLVQRLSSPKKQK